MDTDLIGSPASPQMVPLEETNQAEGETHRVTDYQFSEKTT